MFTCLVTEFTLVAVVGVLAGTALAIGGSIAFFRGIGAGIALPTIPVFVIAALMFVGIAAGSAAALAFLEREGIALQSIESSKADLEEVFLALTGRRLRDG